MKLLSDVEALSLYNSNHGKVINTQASLNSSLLALEEQLKKAKPDMKNVFNEQISITKKNLDKLNVLYEVGEHKVRKTSPFVPANKIKEQVKELDIPVFVDWGIANSPVFQDLFDCLNDMPCIDQCPEGYRKEREDLLLHPNEEMIRRFLGRLPNNVEFPKEWVKIRGHALDHRKMPAYFRRQSQTWFKKSAKSKVQ